MLTALVDDPARVGLTAGELRAIAAGHGAAAALDQVAQRTGHPLEWCEGRHRGLPNFPDELTVIAPLVGFATIGRPVDEASRERGRSAVARALLARYLEELDTFEAELAATQANLAEHLRPKRRPADPPAPVAPLPAGGLRDMFTGEARMPVYSDEPRERRSDQRRLF